MVVAGAGGGPGVSLAGLGVVRLAAADMGVALGPGGRRASAVISASARTGTRHARRRGTLPGIDVVVAGARDVAGAAGGAVHRAVIAARRVARPRVVLPACIDVAGGAGARIGVGTAEGRPRDTAARVPRARTRVRGGAPVAVDVGARGGAAAVAAPVAGIVVGAAPPGLHPCGRGEAHRKPPRVSHVGVVDRHRGDAVRVRWRVPVGADPRRVVVTGAIDDGAVRRDHRAEIPRRVADVDDLRRCLVDPHVGHVMDRRGRGDRVDHRRHAGGDSPRTGQLRRGEPDARGHRVEAVRGHLDHRRVRVRHVGERRAGDGRELRRAVEFGRELRPVLERHGRRLRDGVLDDRLLRLRCAGDGRQHGTGERMWRDAREVGRQRVVGDECPRPIEAARREPPAGEQRVVVVVGGVDQDVARRVRRPQQLRADNGHEIRLALEDDKLRGRLARVDRRHAVGERRLGIGLRPAVEEIDEAGLGELLRDIVDARGRQERLLPGSGDRGRRQPAVVHVDEEPRDEPVLQDQRARVDHPIEARIAGDGLDHRRAVDRHQDGRTVADQHLRRVVLHGHRGRLDAGDGER